MHAKRRNPSSEYNHRNHLTGFHATGPNISGYFRDYVIMRALILSDIHANLEALEAVISDAEDRGGFDVTWCLGDTVGYGPDPGPCIDRIREFELVAVAGNHDHAAVGLIDAADFNDAAKAAADWTSGQLDTDQQLFLSSLPFVSLQSPFTLVHGSLRDPIVEYLLDRNSAVGTLDLMETDYCLVGHSHIPFVCSEVTDNPLDPAFADFPEDEPVELGTKRRIINPGGVGQPRDRDSRPSYAVYDSSTVAVERHRVTYDIAKTQKKMKAAELPGHLIDRLDHGI